VLPLPALTYKNGAESVEKLIQWAKAKKTQTGGTGNG
jgi:hypothetical protein